MTDFYYLASSGGNPSQIEIQRKVKGANVATPVVLNQLYSGFPTVSDMHFSPRANYLALGSESGAWSAVRIRIFRRSTIDSFDEVDSSKITFPAATISGSVQDLRFSPNGRFLASVSATSSMYAVAVFNIDKAEDTFTATASTMITGFSSQSCSWSVDSKYLFVSSRVAPYIRCYSVADDGTLAVVGTVDTQPSNYPQVLRVSPDGKTLVASNPTAPFVDVYSINGPNLTKITTGNLGTAIPTGMEWFGNNRLVVATGSAQLTAITYRRSGNNFYSQALPRPFAVNANAVSAAPDQEIVAFGLSNNTYRFWTYSYDKSTEVFTYNSNINTTAAIIQSSVAVSAMQSTEAGEVIKLYDDTLYDLLNGTVDLTNVKICLLNSTGALNFVATHTTLEEVIGANEVYNAGWPQGGIVLADTKFERIGNDDISLTFDQTIHTYMVEPNLEFFAAVIYDATHVDQKPLAFIKFEEAQVAKQFDEMRFATLGVLIQFRPEL